MPSSATTSLRIEQQADGENAGVWGQKVNSNNLLFEQAVAGRVAVLISGGIDVVLAATNYAIDQARAAIVELTGLNNAAINVIVPTATKRWTFYNNSTGTGSITIKGATGTGIAVPQGKRMALYHDGTNVVEELTFISALLARDQSNIVGTDTGGAANTYVVTPPGTPPGALTTGLLVIFRASNGSNGAACTLNAWGLGAQPFVRPDNSVPLNGDIGGGAITIAAWNATATRWELISNYANLKSMATQAANAVAITGGTIDGITLDGGTF